MSTPRLFISMGTPYTTDYGLFRDGLESFLRDRCQVDPRIIGKNEYPSGSPLNKIKEVMTGCDGVIVVAYERKFLVTGTDKRGGDGQRELANNAYTTPWNHIESAMAFSLGLPLYIICQKGLTEEGLIESKIDWYVQYADIAPASLLLPEVQESIRSWVHTRVANRPRKPRIFQAMERGLRLSDLTFKEIVSIVGLLFAVFSLGAAAATFFPRLFH